MILVLRIIQYNYTDGEVMARDMARWTTNMKTRDMRMTSTSLNPEYILEPSNPSMSPDVVRADRLRELANMADELPGSEGLYQALHDMADKLAPLDLDPLQETIEQPTEQTTTEGTHSS